MANKKELPTVEEILRGTSHALTIFKPGAVDDLKLFAKRGKPFLKCFACGFPTLLKIPKATWRNW